MLLEDFAHPVIHATRTQLLTARAVARRMVEQGSGVILTITRGLPAGLPQRRRLRIVLRGYRGLAKLGRLPALAEVANAATITASDRASAMAGVIADVTCGYIAD